MPNPIDGYRDVNSWPYGWSVDFAPAVLAWLDELGDTVFFFEPWTYENHFRIEPEEEEGAWRYALDLFDGGTADVRAQMPKAKGDEIAAFASSGWDEEIRAIMWMYNAWTPARGWHPYVGPQGDFPDRVHIEFNVAGLRKWHAGLDVVT